MLLGEKMSAWQGMTSDIDGALFPQAQWIEAALNHAVLTP